jgi:hypothetical protein
MKAERSAYVDIEDGTYVVELASWEDYELDGSRFGSGMRPGLKFHFTLPDVVNEDGEPVELTAVATAEKLTPKTKLWNWTEALTGQRLEFDDELDLDNLVGHRALALVVNEEADGSRWARIKSLQPLPKAPARKSFAERVNAE